MRKCDRFWYENGNPLIRFTEAQLAEIRKITLSKVICENCDEVTNVQRAMYVLIPLYWVFHEGGLISFIVTVELKLNSTLLQIIVAEINPLLLLCMAARRVIWVKDFTDVLSCCYFL